MVDLCPRVLCMASTPSILDTRLRPSEVRSFIGGWLCEHVFGLPWSSLP